MAAVILQRPAPPGRDTRSAVRALYVRACDPEASVPGGPLPPAIRDAMREAPSGRDPGSVDELARAARAWAGEEAARYRDLLALAGDAERRDVLARRAVLACAPLGLVLGAWLQWTSAPSNADDPATLGLLRVYARDVGVGHPRATRGNAFLALLSRLGLAEHAVPTANLTLDQRIGDSAFTIPALLLAASRRPDDLHAEIAGADLCLRVVGLLPPLALVRDVHPAAADWDALDPGCARGSPGASCAQQMREAVDALAAGTDAGGAGRVTTGFAWVLAALRRWSAEVRADLDAARDPAYEMAELLRLRAREGAVYHRDHHLEGRPLSRWLEDSRTDPGPLLEALARSPLVRPGQADASALVGKLIGEGGPMFRVFSPQDVGVIRRWIDALPAGNAQPLPAPRDPAPAGDLPPLLPALEAPLERGREPADLREAYHLLQTRHDTVELRRFATSYVHGWLGRARHRIEASGLPLPERWEREGLRPWLVEMHDRHGREFEDGREVPVPSREELIDSTVQLAPLTLIDGSWLRGFTDYGLAGSEVGHFLFETYWDELGNGEPRLNHPLLYREVLDEMGVHLPPTRSPEFSRWDGFRDAAFELPVYWLCVGRFPLTFTPEVLGLNLAMELSGVGGTYRRAHIALRRYGFSTRFVDIHNTIDNVATGHSAWAADAVDTYMTSIQPGPGRAAAWERVRAGYRSLNPPGGFWARFAGRRARQRKEPARG